MPLSPAEIALLSRLFDEAAELSPPALEAWLAARPPAEQALLPTLRRMLAQPGRLPESLPQLADLPASPDTLARPAGPALELPAPRPGDTVGAYCLLREIGRGGMGTVWLAERADGLYARQVAVKLPRQSARSDLAERMAAERRIAARLEHPHIARLYDAGIDAAGRPYLVMEHVDGLPLGEWRQRGSPTPPAPSACVRLLLQACDAVAFAHRQLVVHRDIKPSNLMVDRAGDLRLLDFGIARLLDDADPPAGTSPGSRRGSHTPGYAAPEQLRGAPVSTAADQYALAVVLHELLCGRLPSEGRPDPALGRDWAAVLARALHADPAQRYGSVDQFADDLRRVLAHRPPQADPGPWPHRLALALRRHRVGALLAAAVLLVLGASAGLAWQQQAIARAEALRTAQAREFLFDLLEDTEPMEGEAAAPAGAALLQAALERARASFADQPALRGDVLVQLGLMLRRHGEAAPALQALQEGQALLATAAAADDPALARARAQLAQQWLLVAEPDLDQASGLAQAALGPCRRDAQRCAKAAAYAHTALLQIARRRGATAQALDHARAALQAHEQGFGAADAETLLARLQLAIVLRNSGRLLEAAAALAPVREQARGLRLRVADRLQLGLWDAVIEADLGRHGAALERLDGLLAGPGAATMAPTLRRLRAQSLQAQGRWEPALVAAQAAALSAEAAGSAFEQALSGHAQVRALLALGRIGEAQAALDSAEARLQRLGLAEGSLERLRGARLAAELQARGAQTEAAAQALQALAERHRAAGPGAAPADLAQVLDLLGALARRRGDFGAAAAHHAEAGRLLAGLPAAHPLRRRNAVDAALAAALAGGPAEPLAAAVRDWSTELPADAGWQPGLARLAADPAAGRAWWW